MKDLFKNEKDTPKKIKFLKKRISLQKKISSIPLNLVWNEKLNIYNDQIEKLIKLHYDLLYLQKEVAWEIAKNLGRLEFAANRWRKAVYLWKNAISN